MMRLQSTQLLKIFLAFLMLTIASMGTTATAKAEQIANDARDAVIMRVLDKFMDGLNELDLQKHFETYHFPHFRYASGTINISENAEEAMPFLKLSKEQQRQNLLKFLGPEWDHSAWTRRDIVQGDESKVHVATTFVRFRKDGSKIQAYESLYVIVFENGRWGIKGRSSFAP
ncbi:hypothetical protein [Sphingorhabdus sp. Alg231-15]|uniref:hypothetical protein n=1 Tax=Sphingorhabdus sp. Alg231-15 TaxID=1922222 RepID=UPI000D554B3F